MELDLTARRNLELTETLRGGEKKGSLLWVLDKTCTPMGHRLIRSWLERPLLSPVQIGKRQGAVADLVGDSVARQEIARELKEVTDLERLIGRVVYGVMNALVFSAGSYSMAVFVSAAFVTALPGIIIQLVALPPLVLLLEKARLLESPYAVAA